MVKQLNIKNVGVCQIFEVKATQLIFLCLCCVQKVTSMIKVKCSWKRMHFPFMKLNLFFSSLMTLSLFFTFVVMLQNSIHLRSQMFLLATCMIQINPLLVIPFPLVYVASCWIWEQSWIWNYLETQARSISVSYRPQPLRGRTNQCNFPRPVSLIYPEAP